MPLNIDLQRHDCNGDENNLTTPNAADSLPENITCLNSPVKVFLLTVPRRCFFCGSFLLVMLHAGVYCNVVSVLCSHVVTCWERADLLALVCGV